MQIYRLEFNEKQQHFHLDWNNAHGENTHGWKTIDKNCTDAKYALFDVYMKSTFDLDIDNLSEGKLVTCKFILECYAKFEMFLFGAANRKFKIERDF